MIKLSRGDIISVSLFNDLVFMSGSNEARIQTLEVNVRNTRSKLMQLLRELELARRQPSVTQVSETTLIDFFVAHPSMTISYEDGKLTLRSSNQSVAFHTRRERNDAGINNDIIYVTLPLYSFKLDFFPDGSVVGCSERSDTLEEVFSGYAPIQYGHPHTRHRNGSRTFASLCNGNNRFIQDWSYMRSNGVMDGANTMRILSQAAIWMETANISDMYGTELARGPHVSEDIIENVDVDGFYYCRIPVGDEAPALRFIFDSYGAWMHRMALWPLWMVKHFYELPDCLNRCVSLYQAALYDALIILKKPEAFGAIYAANHEELNRIFPIVTRCYTELGGYKPYYDSTNRTISRILPELFPENFNPNNMEAYNESNQRATQNSGSYADQGANNCASRAS